MWLWNIGKLDPVPSLRKWEKEADIYDLSRTSFENKLCNILREEYQEREKKCLCLWICWLSHRYSLWQMDFAIAVLLSLSLFAMFDNRIGIVRSFFACESPNPVRGRFPDLPFTHCYFRLQFQAVLEWITRSARAHRPLHSGLLFSRVDWHRYRKCAPWFHLVISWPCHQCRYDLAFLDNLGRSRLTAK